MIGKSIEKNKTLIYLQGNSVEAESFDCVTIFFSDIVVCDTRNATIAALDKFDTKLTLHHLSPLYKDRLLWQPCPLLLS